MSHTSIWIWAMSSSYVGILQMEYDGIQFYFIDNEYYFSGPKPYDSAPWDLEKFAFFSKAALSVLPVIGFPTGHYSLPRLADRPGSCLPS